MNHYSIYWIRKEFAHFFYYKSEILYRFIKSYEHDRNREDLASQFQYITQTFPCSLLTTHITECLPSDTVAIKNNDLLNIYANDERYISLHMEKKRINFRSDIIYDAEDLLFPALRSFQPYLFVVGNNTEDFGWVSPVCRLTKMDKIGQVLYSCL
ncbi:sporulation inhibitor of replication protein SirA [Lentibacillus halophilus]|uniref:sporulation inhibitor of replication protein SirA n=1 Tax=Lentibacillus halophilus TaxID=295065 RepID=UPI0031E32C6A